MRRKIELSETIFKMQMGDQSYKEDMWEVGFRDYLNSSLVGGGKNARLLPND